MTNLDFMVVIPLVREMIKSARPENYPIMLRDYLFDCLIHETNKFFNTDIPTSLSVNQIMFCGVPIKRQMCSTLEITSDVILVNTIVRLKKALVDEVKTNGLP